MGMGFGFFARAALSAALLCAAAPGAAVVYTVTYSGTISSGYDQVGQFGSVGDLFGESVNVKLIIDTSHGHLIANDPGEPFSQWANYIGSNPFGELNSLIIVSPTITINGISAVYPAAGISSVSDLAESGIGPSAASSVRSTGFLFGTPVSVNFGVDLTAKDQLFAAPLNQPVSLVLKNNADIYENDGALYIFRFDNRQTVTGMVTAYFSIDQLTVASGYDVAGVPEPATWGLMLAGFGAMGAALRRWRAVAAA